MRCHPLLGAPVGMLTPLRTGGVTGCIGEFGLTRTRRDGSLRMHKGIDLLCPVNWPIFAAHDGIVTFVGEQRGYGLLIKIVASRFAVSLERAGTRYAHLSTAAVKVGDSLRANDLIGFSGVSGNAIGTTPHLHFEVRLYSKRKWNLRDPAKWLTGGIEL